MIRITSFKKIYINKIRIKKTGSNFVYIQLFYILIVFFLRDVLGFPSWITYLTDVLMLLSLIVCYGKMQREFSKTTARVQFWIIVAIFISICIGAVGNFVDPLLFIWGFRNNFRFFIFWISCVVLLKKEDVDNLFNLFRVFFWLNILLSTFQRFVQGIVIKDAIGGFFGTQSGCNAYTIILILIVMTQIISQYFMSKISITKLLVYSFGAMYLATLAELKIIYFDFIFIVIIAILWKKPTLKTFGLILISAVGLMFGIAFLERYSPDSVSVILDLDDFISYLTGSGYTNSGDLNRFTAVGEIQDMFFSDNWFNKLFGFGLGSGDTSNFDFFKSSFYEKYSYLHYRWFTHAWVYLEQGAVGLILLIAFILSVFFVCVKNRKRDQGGYFLTSSLFVVTTLIGIIYNCALELEACYMIAFMLAIPFIIIKSLSKKNSNYVI